MGENERVVESETDTTPEDVYHDAARHFLDVQIGTLDILDGKAAQAFSVGSVVLPVTFALLNLGSATNTPTIAEWALGSALTFYVVLLICASQASRSRELQYRPHVPTLEKHSQNYAGKTLKRWVADEYERSILANGEVLQKKGVWVGIATVALHLEALSLSIAAIATLLL